MLCFIVIFSQNMLIENKRKEINQIDEQIIELIIKRNEISNSILEYKKSKNINLYDKNREFDIIEKLKKKYFDKINSQEIEKLYSYILFYSKESFLNNSNNDCFQLLNQKPIVIAGPCSIESEKQIFEIAEQLSKIGIKYLRGGAFKPRTSPDTFQGLGNIGLEFMKKAADKFNMKIVTEVLSAQQLKDNYNLIDIIQIGSRNMFSYQLLKDIVKINKDNKPIILKRNFNATLSEFVMASDYLTKNNNNQVILCLRGIRTFEQINSELRYTPDLASISELRKLTKLPILFDPSHATGKSEYVYDITKGALALGADGIMIETHYNPDESLVDSRQTIDITTMKMIFSFIEQIKYACS